MSDDEKRKRSWREIDLARDRSQRPPPGPGGARGKRAAEQASKQYRSALDALFDKGGFGKVAEVLGKPLDAPAAAPAEGDAARLALRARIVEAIGREEVTRAVDRYVARWPLPADWEVLTQALDHTDEARVAEVLATIELLAARDKPRRARALVGKLRLLEETGGDPDLRRRAGALRARLG